MGSLRQNAFITVELQKPLAHIVLPRFGDVRHLRHPTRNFSELKEEGVLETRKVMIDCRVGNSLCPELPITFKILRLQQGDLLSLNRKMDGGWPRCTFQ